MDITKALNALNVLGASITAEEKALLAQAAKERADIIDKYDKVTPIWASLSISLLSIDVIQNSSATAS